MEFIDGHPVTRHSVRFRYRSEINEAQAELVKDGSVVVWLVRARCQPPAYLAVTKEDEDRLRLSVQDVEAVIPLDDDLRDSALAYLDRGDRDQLFVDHNGNVGFAFEAWDREKADFDVSRLAAFLDQRGELGDENPVDVAIRLLRHGEDRESMPVGHVSDGLSDPPRATDLVSGYLNDTDPEPESGDVEILGSVYHGRRPSWMEDR